MYNNSNVQGFFFWKKIRFKCKLWSLTPWLRFIFTFYRILFCLTFVSILDWVMRGWSCLSHLCTILMGHSDIVEVIIFFKPSQCSYHIFTHWAGIAIVHNLLNSRDSGDYLDESGGSGESRQGPRIWLIWWMWLIWLICTFRWLGWIWWIWGFWWYWWY